METGLFINLSGDLIRVSINDNCHKGKCFVERFGKDNWQRYYPISTIKSYIKSGGMRFASKAEKILLGVDIEN